MLELSENGEQTDRCELDVVLHHVGQPGARITVLYVHGWKHDGARLDPDLLRFRKLLAQLDSLETRRVMSEDARPALRRPVVGVYLAWPGRATHLRGFDWLTFFGRKARADRISQSETVTRLVSAMDERRRMGRQAVKRNLSADDDLTVFIGHGLGARILFTATAPALVDRVEQAHPLQERAYASVEGVADLVVLLNPVFEASLFTAIQAQRREDVPFSDTQRPLLLSLSSEADRTTRKVFPLGKRLVLDGSPMRRTTLGNYRPFQTHRLSRGGIPSPAAAADGDGSGRDSPAWFERFCAASLCLQQTATVRQPNNPYLVVTVDRSIMAGHGDVWGTALTSWLAAFLSRLDRSQ